MADRSGNGWWDPASVGAFVGAVATAIVAAAIKLRGLFTRSATPPQEPSPAQRFPTPPQGVDSDGILDVIARLGAELRERDRKIDALDLRLRESERRQRELADRVRELEEELHGWRTSHG